MTPEFTLISHALCPYVQRVAIVLIEKGLAFKRVDIDLSHKPDWFLKLSPHAKTPVLLADGQPIFESAAICDYLDETTAHRMHPDDPLLRAQHRGWIAFASATLDSIGGMYTAPDDAAFGSKLNGIKNRFEQLDAVLAAATGPGPYFAGEDFCIVDAAFAPVFRYFDVLDNIAGIQLFATTPRVRAWRTALGKRASVRCAVQDDYPALLRTFLLRRNSALSRLMADDVQRMA